MRIAHANQLVLGHDDQRVGAFNAVEALHQVVALAVQGWLGQQVQNDFAIHGGLEDRAPGLEFFAEPGGVGQVAVVRDGNLATGAVHGERLGVAQVRGAGGGVTGMADGNGAGHVMQDVALEDL